MSTMNACVNCNQLITTGQRRLQCDSCHQNVHVECTGITDEKITRNRARSVKIVCNGCNAKFEQVTDIKELIESLKNDMNEKIRSLEQKLTDIETKLNNTNQNNAAVSPKQIEIITVEAVERINRAKNIIIKNVREDTGTIEERSRSDANKVADILSALDTTEVPMSINRLGRNPSSRFPRPLKVTFSCQATARFVLRNKHKLLDNQSTKQIKIFDDKTPTQINYLNSVREELQNRSEEGEENLTIKYIRGIPEVIEKLPKN